MKKSRILLVSVVLCFFMFGIWQNSSANYENTNNFSRDVKTVDYSELKFTPWDVKAASANVANQGTKPYTIMVYMNGSDLESENGAATDDLIEMLESGVSSDNVNIVIFTGGTNRWQNDVIPENECMLWQISDGNLYEIAGVGLFNMGDAGTLSSFIDFSINNFPAEKYGLVLWDHGGGSIAGYGHDENFNNSNLTLLDFNYAFEKSKLANQKIEFIGFDSCLMATIEMSVVASGYFNYLIASEELEPGEGWDYSFLKVLNDNPKMDGATLGMAITDYFIDFYGMYSDENLALSVIDLAIVDRVMGAMGQLMVLCSDDLIRDRATSFKAFAKKRSRTKTFGEGSPRDNACDMVDLGDMANKLSDLFPNETANVLDALNTSVVYNRHNSDIDLKGLSAYYIYGGKENANESLSIYAALNMDENYTSYLFNFFDLLSNDGEITQKKISRSSGM